jgi:hypothetical protein
LTGENRSTRRKTCPSATLFTTNATWIHPDANPGSRGERHSQFGPLPVLYNFLCVQGTLKRRDHLKESKFFDCTCARCSDATELGTYAGALKCPQCATGVVVSTAPLNHDADWCCTNDACTGYIVPARSVRLLMDK